MRKPVKKSIRFEVFKRDSFKCQYCGSEAPSVLLHIDHIHPVAAGGDNDITNLITSCQECNLGKRDRQLSDKSRIQKSKNQLNELQKRREQLELMMEWRSGLKQITNETLSSIVKLWKEKIPNWGVSPSGEAHFKRLLSKYSVTEVADAIEVASEQYLEFDEEGKITRDSICNALEKIDGILHWARVFKKNPGLKDLYHVRAIMKKRFHQYSVQTHGLRLLKEASAHGVSTETLKEMTLEHGSWTSFRDAVEGLIYE